MAPLNVYKMADMGVNVTKSPIHLDDGEVVKAQNWQTDPTLADGAIRRRDALVKLNSSALAGAVKGMIALPYPDNFVVARTFYAPIDDATTDTWRISTTGAAASWSTITTSTLLKARTSVDVGGTSIFGGLRGLPTWASFNHKIYFPGSDYNSPAEAGDNTPPSVYSWDGTTALKLFTVPPEPNTYPNLATTVTCIVPYSDTELMIGVLSRSPTTSDYYGSLLLYDTVTGALEQLGPATSLIHELIFAPYVYQGRIWLGSTYFGLAGSSITTKWVRPGDATWTTDVTFPAVNQGGTNMAQFLGDLYLGTHSTTAEAATIRKRATATAAWSIVKSTDGAPGAANSYIGPLIVTADKLTILAFYTAGGAGATGPIQRILSSTDGTTWITDLDVVATLGAGYGISGIPTLDSDGSIYWVLKTSTDITATLKRTSAGSWSTVDTLGAGAGLHGPMLQLKVVT